MPDALARSAAGAAAWAAHPQGGWPNRGSRPDTHTRILRCMAPLRPPPRPHPSTQRGEASVTCCASVREAKKGRDVAGMVNVPPQVGRPACGPSRRQFRPRQRSGRPLPVAVPARAGNRASGPNRRDHRHPRGNKRRAARPPEIEAHSWHLGEGRGAGCCRKPINRPSRTRNFSGLSPVYPNGIRITRGVRGRGVTDRGARGETRTRMPCGGGF